MAAERWVPKLLCMIKDVAIRLREFIYPGHQFCDNLQIVLIFNYSFSFCGRIIKLQTEFSQQLGWQIEPLLFPLYITLFVVVLGPPTQATVGFGNKCCSEEENMFVLFYTPTQSTEGWEFGQQFCSKDRIRSIKITRFSQSGPMQKKRIYLFK